MIIECPECGTKNTTDKTPQPGKRYRCGKCGTVITFPLITDIDKENAEITSKQIKEMETLKDIVTNWALLSTKSVRDTWPSATGEDSMPWKSNFIVRSEMLWFLLHMVSRYAFAISAEARAALQDEIVENAIQRVLIASFDSSHAKKGFDVKGWETRMASEALEEFNEAEIDYSSCKSLGVENSGDFAREETILGKLATRINRLVSEEYDMPLRLLIYGTAIEALSKSGLKEQVQKACGVLR